MNQNQAKIVSARLRKLAKEIRETAKGSGRAAMYESIAAEVDETADQVSSLAEKK